MNRCLSCHEELQDEKKYHTKCLKQLFNVSWSPFIPFTMSDFPLEVSKIVDKMSISGVQPKTSVRVNKIKKELEIVEKNGTHILKTEPNEFPELPQNENLCMNIARALYIEVPPHALCPMADGKLCYVVLRFDRLPNGTKIHKEDMAQLLEYATENKYKGSLEQVGKVIQQHAKNVYLDLINFFERILLCFIIGNGDMHLKNWALLRLPIENKIAPCYDLVCSKLYLPNEDESALTINGKRNRLNKQDFEALGRTLKIDQKAMQNTFEKLFSARDKLTAMVFDSLLSKKKKSMMAEIIKTRYDTIFH